MYVLREYINHEKIFVLCEYIYQIYVLCEYKYMSCVNTCI